MRGAGSFSSCYSRADDDGFVLIAWSFVRGHQHGADAQKGPTWSRGTPPRPSTETHAARLRLTPSHAGGASAGHDLGDLRQALWQVACAADDSTANRDIRAERGARVRLPRPLRQTVHRLSTLAERSFTRINHARGLAPRYNRKREDVPAAVKPDLASTPVRPRPRPCPSKAPARAQPGASRCQSSSR